MHKRSVDVLNFFLHYSLYSALNWGRLKKSAELPTDRPLLFVSNHQSTFDIPGLIYYFRKYHAKFVSKIELSRARIPSISFNLIHGGAANIDRKDPEQSKREIARLANDMRTKNWSAFIFPEGTRTRDGKMKPFKIGGIEAFTNEIPDLLVVPVAITGSYQLVKKGYFPLMPFNKMTWEILAPIETKDREITDVVNEAENAIRRIVEK